MTQAVRRSLVHLAVIAALGATLLAQGTGFPLADKSVRFAVIGDMGTGLPPQLEVGAAMVAARQSFPFEFVIMLGDNIYGGNSPRDFEDKFTRPYKALLDAGILFYGALGNHDSPSQRLYKPFNMDGRQYYSFRKGHVQFFVLDTNYLSPPQLTWLRTELQASNAEWKVAYFHHPLYSSGAYHGSSGELRSVLEPLFVQYGVQVVFAGHEHVYERLNPQKGIAYFVEGASGQMRRGNLKGGTGMTAVGYDKDRSFMLVEVAGDTLTFQAISRTGAVVDSGTIARMAPLLGPGAVSATPPGGTPPAPPPAAAR